MQVKKHLERPKPRIVSYGDYSPIKDVLFAVSILGFFILIGLILGAK